MKVNKVEPAVHACRTRICLKTERGMQLFVYCISMTEMLWVPPTTRVIYLWTYNIFKHFVSCLIGPAALQCCDRWISFLAMVWHQMGRLMNNFLVMKQGAGMKHGANRWGRQTNRQIICSRAMLRCWLTVNISSQVRWDVSALAANS